MLRGDLLPHHFKEEEIREYEKDIHELAQRIQVMHDLSMTARTFLTFPQVVSVVKRMDKEERHQALNHLRTMKSTKAPLKHRIKNVLKLITTKEGRVLMKKLLRKDDSEISLKSLNLPEFPMLQSARARIIFKDGRSATADIPILTGGAGLPLEERKDWVKKRFKMAFNKDPEPTFRKLDDLQMPIDEFIQFVLSKGIPVE